MSGKILDRTSSATLEAPRHAGSLNILGVIASQRGQYESAAELIRRAIQIDPTEPSYHLNLGLVRREQGWLREAAACFRTAIRLKPDHPDSYNNLGVVLAETGALDEAALAYSQALRLNPLYAEALNNLGNVRRDQGCLGQAADFYSQALALAPDFADGWNNLGVALAEQGFKDQAMQAYRRALALAPELADAHYNLSLAQLAQGDFAAGWAGYEWRFHTRPLAAGRRYFALPQWRGERAAGRTLLIHAEQGFGDSIQFMRYVPLAAASGFNVVLEVPAPLARLAATLPDVQVVTYGEALPAFDLHVPMLSLPLAFGTRLETIPAPRRYLHAEPAALAGPGLKVGLVWAGNPRADKPSLAAVDRRRSLDPALLAPLFAVPGIRYYSLQKDGPAGLPVEDLMPGINDFADTAALIMALDLVIAADTAVAHLAGALGKPVWLLNRYDSCWRWLSGRCDSPWYPTMRIFTQKNPADWGGVIQEIVRGLEESAFL